MSFQAMTWAVKKKVGNATGKAILLMLANYADESGACFPSQETLASECECSKRSVLEWLGKFEAMGIITRERRHDAGGYRRSDILKLNLNAAFSRENISGENNDTPRCSTFTAEPVTEPTSSLRSEDKPKSEVDIAFNAWDEVASKAGLATVRIRTGSRRTKLSAVIRQHTLATWIEACRRVGESDFCCGANDRGWRADLDFLLQAKSFARVIEGHYDNRRPRGSPAPNRNPMLNVIDNLKAEMGAVNERSAENGPNQAAYLRLSHSG